MIAPAGNAAPASPDVIGKRWHIRAIRAGLSANRTFYPDAVLERATSLFDGARVFVKADAEHLDGRGRDVRNLIGRLRSPAFVPGNRADSGAIEATVEIIDPASDVVRKIREAWKGGMSHLFGFSIDAVGSAQPATIDGRKVRRATAIHRVDSVDLIVQPSAGGELLQLIEAAMNVETEEHLTAAQIRAAIESTNLPKVAQDRLKEGYVSRTDLTDAALREAIDGERAYVASLSESGRPHGLGGGSRIELIEGHDEKVGRMLDAFFDPKDSSVVSIRECYLEITGDKGFTGDIRHCDQVRLRESLGSASFASVLGNSVARRMVADYRLPAVFDVWRLVVNVVPVVDFRTQERTRFGGYGDLPKVLERGAYLELASPTDEKATYAVEKYGGTENVTLEMVANDDAGTIIQIPRRLARAAKRTLGKFVLDLLRTNPTIYDNVALFHATHGNLGSAALDATSFAAARLAMLKQAEKNSGERLGIGPRSLLVPPDLEETAVNLFRKNTNQDKTFLQSLSPDVASVWYWTDATNWYAAADPLDIPSIEVGFFNGREEPELFVQDDPRSGSLFANDTITYKIRHVYGATVVDFRGLYGAVVAG